MLDLVIREVSEDFVEKMVFPFSFSLCSPIEQIVVPYFIVQVSSSFGKGTSSEMLIIFSNFLKYRGRASYPSPSSWVQFLMVCRHYRVWTWEQILHSFSWDRFLRWHPDSLEFNLDNEISELVDDGLSWEPLFHGFEQRLYEMTTTWSNSINAIIHLWRKPIN